MLTLRPDKGGQVHGQEGAFPRGSSSMTTASYTFSVVEKQGEAEPQSEAVFICSDEGLYRGFFVSTLCGVP